MPHSPTAADRVKHERGDVGKRQSGWQSEAQISQGLQEVEQARRCGDLEVDLADLVQVLRVDQSTQKAARTGVSGGPGDRGKTESRFNKRAVGTDDCCVRRQQPAQRAARKGGSTSASERKNRRRAHLSERRVSRQRNRVSAPATKQANIDQPQRPATTQRSRKQSHVNVYECSQANDALLPQQRKQRRRVPLHGSQHCATSTGTPGPTGS